MAKKECSLKECIASKNGICHIGHSSLEECENWNNAAASVKIAKTQNGVTALNWSGLKLGLEELTLVAGRNKPFVVGFIGPHNSGKTTLLGVFYSFLAQGKEIGKAKFAGSYSFDGWENIAVYMRWSDDDLPPNFPPHTEMSESRTPGLLHVSLRRTNGKLDDWLFTDAPGEWFKRWSLEENAPDAAGAGWVAAHSNVFVLLIDCEALSGEERGTVRGVYKNIIDRLSQVQRERPVAVVWSKFDKLQGETKTAVLKQHLAKKLINYTEFEVSVNKEGEKNAPTLSEFEKLFIWLAESEKINFRLPAQPSLAPDDFLLSFRG